MHARILPVAALAMSLGVSSAPSAAAEIPAYPNEQEARLATVDEEVLSTQREISKAWRRGDTERAEALRQQFGKLHEEQGQLQRALRLDW